MVGVARVVIVEGEKWFWVDYWEKPWCSFFVGLARGFWRFIIIIIVVVLLARTNHILASSYV